MDDTNFVECLYIYYYMSRTLSNIDLGLMTFLGYC